MNEGGSQTGVGHASRGAGPRPAVVIVTPALATANNGNWHTAARWQRLLEDAAYPVRVLPRWGSDAEDGPAEVLIALHARRSAESIDAHARAHPDRPRLVVLTGTDLYRDIATSPEAQRSLRQATLLVALQDDGPRALPPEQRARCRVVCQSAPRLEPCDKPQPPFVALMAGHLRDEKDPLCFLRAAQRLAAREDLAFEHVGRSLDAALEAAVRATMRSQPRYRWSGELAQEATRERIRRAHVLVNASRMEGGAQVVIEAVQSGTAVLASRVGGHVGLLGADHPGLFEPGDDAGLARLLERARDEPGFLHALLAAGERRAARFAPEAERDALLHLLGPWLHDLPSSA